MKQMMKEMHEHFAGHMSTDEVNRIRFVLLVEYYQVFPMLVPVDRHLIFLKGMDPGGSEEK